MINSGKKPTSSAGPFMLDKIMKLYLNLVRREYRLAGYTGEQSELPIYTVLM